MKMARRDVLIGLGLFVAAGGGTRALIACSSDAGPASTSSAPPPDRGKILGDLATNVFVPAYSDSVVDATALEAAMNTLRDAPSAETLAAARAAWKKARSTWKFTDAFLFGPAGDLALTAGVIDTPGDAKKVEDTIAATTPLDASSIGRLGANQRGLGGIEIVLFDPARDDATMLAAFGPAGSRRGTFGALLASELKAKITTVRDAWTNGYANELTTAGRGSTTFATEHQGVDIVVNSLVSAAEIIITLHLAAPLGIDKGGPPKPDAVESPRADYSIEDILAELAGIEATYLGTRNGVSGLPLSAAVANLNAGADMRMKDALVKAKAAVQAIPGPLRTAVVERRDPVIAAHAACRTVKDELAGDVAGTLGTSLGFNVTDGD
jgi:predicted lipoprotein